jgi:hypothetical protein
VGDIVNLTDVRVIQGRHGLRFLLEATHAIGVCRERLGKHLDRDVTTQTRVARAIHLAHSAGPERGINHIPAEGCTGGETHGWDGTPDYTEPTGVACRRPL